MKRKIINVVKYTLSLSILILLIYWVDLEEIADALANANYYLLAVALFIVTINRVIMAGKWNMLLRVKNVHISLFDATRLYYISNYLGFFLPPSVGADIVRGYYVAKNQYPLEDIISSILVERFVGMIVLVMAGLFGGAVFLSYFGRDTIGLDKLFWITVFISFCLVGLFFLSFNTYFSERLLRILKWNNKKSKIHSLTGKIAKLYKSYLLYGHHKGVLATFCLLTILELATYILRSWIVATALGISAPILYFFAFVPIIVLLVRLPISLHGFGINEMGFVYFLSLIGISETMSFSVGIVDHFILIIGIFPGAWFYARFEKPNMDKLDKAVEGSR